MVRSMLYIMLAIILAGILGSLWGLTSDYNQWGLLTEIIGAAVLGIAIGVLLLTKLWRKEYP